MPFREEAQEAIRASGGRMTPQRQLIIDLLEKARGHLDAEALYQRANERDPNISLATVYRALHTLQAAGLVREQYLSSDHERKHYEPVHKDEGHHFTCRSCGRVLHFRTTLIQALKQQIENDLGAQVLHACLCFEGVCADCRGAEATHTFTNVAHTK